MPCSRSSDESREFAHQNAASRGFDSLQTAEPADAGVNPDVVLIRLWLHVGSLKPNDRSETIPQYISIVCPLRKVSTPTSTRSENASPRAAAKRCANLARKEPPVERISKRPPEPQRKGRRKERPAGAGAGSQGKRSRERRPNRGDFSIRQRKFPERSGF